MARVSDNNAHLRDALLPILSDPRVINDMVALSRRGRPAVEAIGKDVAALKPDIDDAGKQHVGRLIRSALAARGLKPVRSARVRPGNLFAWGAVYGSETSKPDMAAPRPYPTQRRADFEAWLERMQKVIAAAPQPLTSVDEFVASRKADWGE